MANALLLFLVHPRVSADEMRRLVQYAMSCMLGHLKVLRLPAACALLMLSDAAGTAPGARGAGVLAGPRLADILTNLGLCHHAGETGANQAMSRADTLPRRRRICTGRGRTRAEAVAKAERRGRRRRVISSSLRAEVQTSPPSRRRRSPRNSRVPFEPRRSRVAIEARGAPRRRRRGDPRLPRDAGTPWAVATSSNRRRSRRRRHRGMASAVRYAVRGESIAERAGILDVIVARPDRDVATVAQQARRLEAALMSSAQLSRRARGQIP